MDILYIYTCVQIIFESLPVSSSGNLALWIPWLKKYFSNTIVLSDTHLFDFILHIPSLCILLLFFPSFYWIFYSKNFYKYFSLLARIAISCFLADIITVCFYLFFKQYPTTHFPLWIGFLITTFFLFSLCFYKHKNKKTIITYRDGLLLGLVQGCALLPGVSRLATTFVAGVWLGYKEKKAFFYSFLIQIPLITAAGFFGIAKMLHNNAQLPCLFFQKTFYMLVLGSSILSFCLLKQVFVMVKHKTFWKFGWYTLFLTIIAY